MSETPVKSPCVSICALDANDMCTGCFRTVAEITQWSRMNNGQRQQVIVRCRERSRKNNPFAL